MAPRDVSRRCCLSVLEARSPLRTATLPAPSSPPRMPVPECRVGRGGAEEPRRFRLAPHAASKVRRDRGRGGGGELVRRLVGDGVGRMRHSRSLSRAIPALPLGVLVGATRGCLVALPRFPLLTPSAPPGASLGAGDAAGVAAFTDRRESTTLWTAEKSKREADHVPCRLPESVARPLRIRQRRECATSILPEPLPRTRMPTSATHARPASSLPGRMMTTRSDQIRGGLVRFARFYAIFDTTSSRTSTRRTERS